MTLLELIKEKGLSRYSLSKISGVEWDTLSDLCSGETGFEQCSMETLSKLAEALGIDTEELVLMETGNDMDEDGRPRDKNTWRQGCRKACNIPLMNLFRGRNDFKLFCKSGFKSFLNFFKTLHFI